MPLTQQHLAAMIGVTRPSVTSVACCLQTEGLISYRRGHIRIENVDRLRALSCECHEAVRLNYKRVFGSFVVTNALKPPNSIMRDCSGFSSLQTKAPRN
jgi:hypothetical protein